MPPRKPDRRRPTPLDPCVVYVERITNVSQEYGYLVAVFGPFRNEHAAKGWISTLKANHPTFADDGRYWIGVRPLRNPAD